MNLIEAKNLSLKIGRNPILSDLNFSVPDHSFFCILGPNGAGKSMLIKLILGLFEASAGSLKVFDQSPAQVPAEWVGYVPQIKTFDRSFPGLSTELVISGELGRWPARMTSAQRAKAREALKMVGAESLEDRSLHQLSGGELQRVFLARAFILPRRLLILDEPATGIDTLGEADLYSLLEEYGKRNSCNIIMITHDVDVARHHASHVLLLNHRQIQFSDRDSGLSEEQLERAFGHSQHHHA
ncbi:MAG: ABC transporter ATP-binding protein [Bradymonadales bacterium]|nr:MAG: ABC transporter ATP-binding protein [Bradymonadales bacterium]